MRASPAARHVRRIAPGDSPGPDHARRPARAHRLARRPDDRGRRAVSPPRARARFATGSRDPAPRFGSARSSPSWRGSPVSAGIPTRRRGFSLRRPRPRRRPTSTSTSDRARRVMTVITTGTPGRVRPVHATAVRDLRSPSAGSTASRGSRPMRRARCGSRLPSSAGCGARLPTSPAGPRSALEALARPFGPYPWPSLNLAVVPDLDRVGIEYPTMIFLGENGVARTTTPRVGAPVVLLAGRERSGPRSRTGRGACHLLPGRARSHLALPRRLARPARLRPLTGRPMSFWEARPHDQYELGIYANGARMMHALGGLRCGHVRPAPVCRCQRLRDRDPGRSGAGPDRRRSRRATRSGRVRRAARIGVRGIR